MYLKLQFLLKIWSGHSILRPHSILVKSLHIQYVKELVGMTYGTLVVT